MKLKYGWYVFGDLKGSYIVGLVKDRRPWYLKFFGGKILVVMDCTFPTVYWHTHKQYMVDDEGLFMKWWTLFGPYHGRTEARSMKDEILRKMGDGVKGCIENNHGVLDTKEFAE